MAKYKLKLTLNTGEVITSNAIEIPPSITGMEFEEQVPEGFEVTIVIANSKHTSEWVSTIVYDDRDNTHEIGRFTSANGTLTVVVTTGVIDIVFSGGMMYISPQPTMTSGITIDYGDSNHYRFNITSDGTINYGKI